MNKSLNLKGLMTKVCFLFTPQSVVALVAFYPAYSQVAIQLLRLFPFYYSAIFESFTCSHTGEKEGREYTRALNDRRPEIAPHLGSYPIGLTQPHCPIELQEKVGN